MIIFFYIDYIILPTKTPFHSSSFLPLRHSTNKHTYIHKYMYIYFYFYFRTDPSLYCHLGLFFVHSFILKTYILLLFWNSITIKHHINIITISSLICFNNIKIRIFHCITVEVQQIWIWLYSLSINGHCSEYPVKYGGNVFVIMY